MKGRPSHGFVRGVQMSYFVSIGWVRHQALHKWQPLRDEHMHRWFQHPSFMALLALLHVILVTGMLSPVSLTSTTGSTMLHVPGHEERVGLHPEFYHETCPQADDIVASTVRKAVAKNPRMAASLLRLYFHDCFVQGCDASLLLDDGPAIKSEKRSVPNRNSIRGLKVVDKIKARLEKACPGAVSCADLLALCARASVIQSGGPTWEVPLGRRDSTTASVSASNTNIPPPNSTLSALLSSFRRQGLGHEDLVALSGAHSIGMARCASFKQRLYDQNGRNMSRSTAELTYLSSLRSACPKKGGDNNLSPLDVASPAVFDNSYFKLLLWGRGLLTSDDVLVTKKAKKVSDLVKRYAADEGAFFHQFSLSMIRMGSLGPLTGSHGEIRKNCHRIN